MTWRHKRSYRIKKKEILLGLLWAAFLLLFSDALLGLVLPAHKTVVDHLPGYWNLPPTYKKITGVAQPYYATADPTFKYSQFPVAKAAGGYRIFCVGESSVQGHSIIYPPDPKEPHAYDLAFPTQLETRLRQAYPARSIEVINAGRDAYETMRIKYVVNEIIGYQPDLVIIYCGHNSWAVELLFDFLDVGLTDNVVIAIQKVLRQSSIYRLLYDFVPRQYDHRSNPGVNNYNYFVYKRELDRIRGNIYQQDLRDMIEKLLKAKVNVILGIPVANLKLPPLESTHRPNLTTADLIDFGRFMQWGLIAELDQRHEAALDQFQKCLRIDPDYALIPYHLAELYEKRGDLAAAKKYYGEARDKDTMPARATSRASEIVRELGRRQPIVIADFEAAFDAALHGQVMGSNLFNDYVHPNRVGHAIMTDTLARLIFEHKLIERKE
jgi:tetratricopeptide (TPR) repeat protein